MKLGVLSDTHNHLKPLQKALAVFQEENIQIILHAGDMENPDHIRVFQGFTMYLVKGNCDDLESLREACKLYSQPPAENSHRLNFDQKSLLLFHGDDNVLYRKAIEEKFDYIIKGHSHFFEDYRKGDSRILNPGALYRSAVYSVGILDTLADTWRKIEISKD